MNNYKCPYDIDQPEFKLEWYEENFEKLLNERDEKEDRIKRTFEDWAEDDVMIENMLEPILGREFINGDSYCVPGIVACVEELVKRYNELKLEKDSMWLKTQEDEREVNDLRDAVDEKKSQRDEAIKVATILQGAYLRIGGAEDKYHTSLIMQECFKRLADLKEMRFFGLNDCCDDPRGRIGSTCDNCGGQVIPEKKLEVS
ncbi:hypothetical protein UFOVP760_32 [uncultured Caudovirales phage]|uniref:Uncharacterized protein n=1 Tax=uncultured Caudovirales phage TaxID=2100421 RepID=A0A6J7XBI1_9CAUD|nr:hypothetical protein UFOVP760_32 [uncultured Caudovirales phage]